MLAISSRSWGFGCSSAKAFKVKEIRGELHVIVVFGECVSAKSQETLDFTMQPSFFLDFPLQSCQHRLLETYASGEKPVNALRILRFCM